MRSAFGGMIRPASGILEVFALFEKQVSQLCPEAVALRACLCASRAANKALLNQLLTIAIRELHPPPHT